MSDKMREAFEARFPVPDDVKWFDGAGKYAATENQLYGADFHALLINARFEAWQAAHAAALPPGFVAVPVEPLREVIRISDRNHDAWDAVKAALQDPQP